MDKILPSRLSEDEESEKNRVLKLRALKETALKPFSPEVREAFDLDFDELLVSVVFQVHMELKIGLFDPEQYKQQCLTPNPSLIHMTEALNISKVNQDIDCPKCFVSVKCLGLSKHLAICMNPHQSGYSYSSRNSSRIARQRIQEGFKTSFEDIKNDSDDERVKVKKRSNKGKKK